LALAVSVVREIMTLQLTTVKLEFEVDLSLQHLNKLHLVAVVAMAECLQQI
jgi:hypothetical protein